MVILVLVLISSPKVVVVVQLTMHWQLLAAPVGEDLLVEQQPEELELWELLTKEMLVDLQAQVYMTMPVVVVVEPVVLVVAIQVIPVALEVQDL